MLLAPRVQRADAERSHVPGQPFAAAGLVIPFAHAGHVLIDLPIYLGPVIVVAAWLKFSSWRDKRSEARAQSQGEHRER
jgi:hypothetical protein